MKINDLIDNLSRIALQPQIIRELIEAFIGHKVSRTSIPDYLLPDLLKILDRYDIASGVSKNKFYSASDHGKGGWCNAAPQSLPSESNIGEHFVYSGIDPDRVLMAINSELAGDNDEFGGLLGIPDCCINHYKTYIDKASKIQNDLTLFTYKNTNFNKEILLGTNYFPQYFGYGLFNYFPCSFNCEETHKRSEAKLNELLKVAPRFMSEFVEHRQRAILYTEYDGIFSFKGATKPNNMFHIESENLLATSKGVIYSILNVATDICVTNLSHIKIYNNQAKLLDVKNEYIAFMDFNARI